MFGGLDAGTAFIDIEPNLKGFGKKLQAKLKPALKESDKIAEQSGERQGTLFSGGFSKSTSDKSNIFRNFLTGLDNLGKKSQQAGTDNGTIFTKMFRKESDGTSIFSGFTRNMLDTKKQTEEAGHSFKGFTKDVFSAKEEMGHLTRIMKIVKWPALITGIDVAAGAFGALAAGAVALVGALAPAAGALIAYPAILGAVAQSTAVLKLGFTGLTTALNAQKEGSVAYAAALKNLTPEQRKFVKQIAPMKKEFDKLKNVAAGAMLPDMGKAALNLKGFLPVLKGIVSDTGHELGSLSLQFSNLLNTNEWKTDLASIGKLNVNTVGDLGHALMGIAGIFKDILIAGKPFIKWFTGSIMGIAEGIGDSVKKARASGGIADFLDETKNLLKIIGPMFSNLGKTIWNVLSIARPMGTDMLGNFKKLTDQWLEFTESSKGKNQIKQFFDDARPAMHQVGKLLGDIIRGFADMATAEGTAGVIKMIRKQLLPAFFAIAETASGDLLPPLIRLAKAFLRMFRVFGSETGGLISTVDLFARFATILANILDKHPGLANLLVTMLSFAQIGKALGIPQLVTFIAHTTTLIALRGSLAGVTASLAGATNGLAAAEAKAATSGKLLSLGAKAGAVGLLAAGAAMAAQHWNDHGMEDMLTKAEKSGAKLAETLLTDENAVSNLKATMPTTMDSILKFKAAVIVATRRVGEQRDRLGELGGKLTDHQQVVYDTMMSTENFAGAMKVLNRAFGDLIPKDARFQSEMEKNKQKTAEAASKVRYLNTLVDALPGNKKIDIRADTSPAIISVQHMLDAFSSASITIDAKLGQIDPHASGGSLSPGINLVGEEGPELIIGRNVVSTAMTKRILENQSKVPLLGEGSIVSEATLAIVGEGNEPESIMPLSKLQALVNAQRFPKEFTGRVTFEDLEKGVLRLVMDDQQDDKKHYRELGRMSR